MIRRPEFPPAGVACQGSAVLLRLYRWLGSETARSRVRRLVLRLESFDLQYGTRFGTRNPKNGDGVDPSLPGSAPIRDIRG